VLHPPPKGVAGGGLIFSTMDKQAEDKTMLSAGGGEERWDVCKVALV
jgi:hypothetical protein